ncbi:MAG: oxaloacetate decarboxylase gamma subunit [Cyclobacteriaceae bacterium]|jgi:oxaloacetate decarboxylase gamma subunit
MESNISTALTLLVIGMLTVFVVLTLVVFTGKLLIALVNRFSVEAIVPLTVNKQGIGSSKIAAITAAVEGFTQGKARIQKIEKL